MKKIIFSFLLFFIFLLTSCFKENDSLNENIPNNEINDKNENSDIIDSDNQIKDDLNDNYVTFTKNLKEEDKTLINNYVTNLMDESTNHIASWNKEGFKGRLNYIDGVFFKSLINLYHQTNDEKYIKFVDNYCKYYIDKDGNYLALNKDGSINESGNGFLNELDSICASMILFDLYDYTKDERYKKAIEYSFDVLMSQTKIKHENDEYFNFQHKEVYVNQVWLDGMYMYAPFLARYASNLTGYKMVNIFNKQVNVDQTYLFNLIKSQFEFIKTNMFDNDYKLYYHGYSITPNDEYSSFWTKEDGCSKNFWGRSMGWLLMGLSDVIEYFPEGNNKVYLKDMLNESIKGLINYIDKDSNMFYDVLNLGKIDVNIPYVYFTEGKDERYDKAKDVDLNNDGVNDAKVYSNYLETSASSMFSYAITSSANKGYIDSATKQTGLNILEGIVKTQLTKTSNGIELKNINVTAGLGGKTNHYSSYYQETNNEYKLYRDGTKEYYLAERVASNEAKGVGPFIMAFVEYLK